MFSLLKSIFNCANSKYKLKTISVSKSEVLEKHLNYYLDSAVTKIKKKIMFPIENNFYCCISRFQDLFKAFLVKFVNSDEYNSNLSLK